MGTLPTGGRIFYTGIGHAGGFLAPAFTRSLSINAIFWTAIQKYVAGGKGWVAVHTTGCEGGGWPWFGEQVTA